MKDKKGFLILVIGMVIFMVGAYALYTQLSEKIAPPEQLATQPTQQTQQTQKAPDFTVYDKEGNFKRSFQGIEDKLYSRIEQFFILNEDELIQYNYNNHYTNHKNRSILLLNNNFLCYMQLIQLCLHIHLLDNMHLCICLLCLVTTPI